MFNVKQGVHGNHGLAFSASLSDGIFTARPLCLVVQPADGGLPSLACIWGLPTGDDITAADIDVAIQIDADGLAHGGRLKGCVANLDTCNDGWVVMGGHDNLISHRDGAAGNPAGITAEVVVRIGLGADNCLHRHAEVTVSKCYLNLLKVSQQRVALVPRHVVTGIHHIVAHQGRKGDEFNLLKLARLGDSVKVLDNGLENAFIVVNQIHFIDANGYGLNA